MNEGSEIKTPETAATTSSERANSISKASARSRLVEKIRSELNIEKWPAIWQPSKSKNKPALRTMEREVIAKDGSSMASRVEVGYTQLGTLTTEEQKLLYVLIQLWEAAGKPDVQVFFSTRGLARMLQKRGWGTNVIQSVTKSLRKLRTIPIEWINSYFDRTANGATVVDRRPFSILSDLRIVERRQDGTVNSSRGYFKFDDHILSNLLLNYTKPVCIDEFLKLKSEIAQLVYTHIDLMLFDKTRYERKSKELFDDLGLRNPEYTHMYERKRALEKAVAELEGIRLSSGTLRFATVEKTKDGKDYKVCFQKTASGEIAHSAPEPVVINNYSKSKDAPTVQAEELVRYFHKTFHNVEDHTPLSKETAQALTLIAQHGIDAAKRVVGFAQAEAAKTKFMIQHFGGVLAYTSRALAQPTRQTQPPRPEVRPTSPTPDNRLYETGERRLAGLSRAEYQIRFEATKAELFRDQPYLAQAGKTGSILVARTVRSRLVRELDCAPMNLALFDPDLPARYPWLYLTTQDSAL